MTVVEIREVVTETIMEVLMAEIVEVYTEATGTQELEVEITEEALIATSRRARVVLLPSVPVLACNGALLLLRLYDKTVDEKRKEKKWREP